MRDSDDHEDSEVTEEVYYPVQSQYLPVFPVIDEPWIKQTEMISKSKHAAAEPSSESPYFQPPRIEGKEKSVRFISPLLQSKSSDLNQTAQEAVEKSILEELLPTTTRNNNSNRNNAATVNTNNYSTTAFLRSLLKNDACFRQLFKVLFTGWLIISLYLVTRPEIKSPLPVDGTIYKSLFETSKWLVLFLAVGVALSFGWAHLLANYPQSVVYGLSFTLPCGFIAVGIYILGHFLSFYGLFAAIIMFGFAGIVGIAVFLNIDNLNTTADIIRTSAIFIQANPQLPIVIVKLSLIYSAFILLWLAAFTTLLQGHLTLSNSALQGFYLMMLIWTGSVMSCSEKFLLALWVREWMNKTEDRDEAEAKSVDRTFGALNERLGSICLAAAVLSASKTIRTLVKLLHLATKWTLEPYFGPIAMVSRWILGLSSTLEKLIERFTDFAVYNLALDQESASFWQSCAIVYSLLQSQLTLAMTADFLAQILLKFLTLLIGIVSIWLMYLVAGVQITLASGTILVVMLSTLLDFITTLFTGSIDSILLCYMIDSRNAEKAAKIDENIKRAFAPKLSGSNV